MLPSYHRGFLAVAYRYLNGKTLAPDQQPHLGYREAVFDVEEPVYTKAGCISSAICEWENARKQVAGVKDEKPVDPYRKGSALYGYYEDRNCYDDAFLRAARKVDEMVARYGRDSDRAREWVGAQDQVFTNCSAGPAIPSPLPDNAGPLARAERSYQIAAAHFYYGDYDAARARFEAIGRDPSSPYREWGDYLAARATIREGALSEAEKLLLTSIHEASDAAAKQRAVNLLHYVDGELHPEARFLEVARDLESTHPQDYQRSLTDYRVLYDRLKSPGLQTAETDKPAIPRDALQKAAEQDDLTAWILAFQSGNRDQIFSHWKSRGGAAWLMAALYAAQAGDGINPSILAAGRQVRPEEPGYVSIQYYAAVLLQREGQMDASRAILNQLLQKQWPPSTQNLLLAARMKIATSWDDFLRDAQRRSSDPSEFSEFKLPPDTPLLDVDGVTAFNSKLPLGFLVEAAKSNTLSKPIRKAVAISAWTRAVLFKRYATAKELTPEMIEFFPADARWFRSLAEATGRTEEVESVWALLHLPGLKPFVEKGFGRGTPLGKIDDYRDNWWCGDPLQHQLGVNEYWEYDVGPIGNLYRGKGDSPLLFLTSEQARTARDEVDALAKGPSGPEFLGKQVLAWAAAEPNDPRIPEALHDVVRVYHYGCGFGQGHSYAEDAFHLLHRRYAGNVWAKQTPFWYR